MKQLCGCCEGTEPLTPVSTANRPGLSALLYRVGTHGSFLETMLARLSSHTLGAASPLDSYTPPGGSPDEGREARPLSALSTREAHDASVAFLDAWATVADVLTFYQERIANEGYLRTAVERRSVLELARLVGYRPRPGVAASVHLAYTLDDGSEVTIPAGSRSQSVPGPGELPQSFETSADLYARAAWNLLRPRLTRPQDPRRQLQRGEALYFKGTATNLKTNDPLLVVLGDGPGRQVLLRVLKVEPDQAADRTKVAVEMWEKGPALTTAVTTTAATAAELAAAVPPPSSSSATFAAASPADAPPAAQVEALRAAIGSHRQTESFGVNADTATARRVLGHLDELEKRLAGDPSPAELRQFLEEALAPLREEHRLAVEGNFNKLEPWIGSIVEVLEAASDSIAPAPPVSASASSFAASASEDDSEGFAASSATTGASAKAATTGAAAQPSSRPALENVSQEFLDNIAKPASVQPRSPQQLGRSLADNFSPTSGTLTKALTANRPGLREAFEKAWGNVPVTEPAGVSVYALRTRASVFGHSAPLKTVFDDDNRVEGQEEWTLFRDVGEPSTDAFIIAVGTPDNVVNNAIMHTVVVEITGTAGRRQSPRVSFPLVNGHTATINVPAPVAEVVTLRVSRPVTGSNDFTLVFTFQQRDVEVSAVISSTQSTAFQTRTLHVESRGTNPSVVLFDPSVSQPASIVSERAVGYLVLEGEVRQSAGSTPTEQPRAVSLDSSYSLILPGSWAAVERPTPLRGAPPRVLVRRVETVAEGSRADYGVSAKGTQLGLDREWINPSLESGDTFEVIRKTTVLAQSELLELAEVPLDPVREDVCGNRVELADLVEGLEPGRLLIVRGERTDITFAAEGGAGAGGVAGEKDPAGLVSGVEAAELVMLAGVEQGYDPALPGDRTHTTLLLAREMAYCYRRDTLRIYGNVAHATHGETRAEVLGSGDAGQAGQTFTLKQSPLTFVSAPTTSGVASTLQVRANEILWHEVDSLAGLGPKDRDYVTKTDDADATTVLFGNGREGARLPTGQENVRAVYRTGLGKEGNVRAGQISMVITKPLGVKEVLNPQAATGGASREERDQMRRNAPLAVMALDRLVSTRDYEDFTRTFAGIGKASAARLTDGRRQLVHLTIAGEDDIPIDVNSDLYQNLRAALSRFGDPYQPVQVAVRQLKLLVAAARVRVHPDYLWESVEPRIRAAMLERFGFNRRALGQDVALSEVTAAVQSVEGVAYADVDTLDELAEDISVEDLLGFSEGLQLKARIRADLARTDRAETDPSKRIRPAQLVTLSPLVPETLNLTELKV
jgi:hypothetical protein